MTKMIDCSSDTTSLSWIPGIAGNSRFVSAHRSSFQHNLKPVIVPPFPESSRNHQEWRRTLFHLTLTPAEAPP
jgi:hypothetical protein